MDTVSVFSGKPRLRGCFLILMVLTAGITASAQWARTNGPSGGGVNGLVLNGSTLFAATFNGLYRSADNARTWTLANSDLGNASAYSLVTNGTQVFAGTERGLFVTSDGGNSWSALAFSNPARKVYSLALNGGYLFALAEDGLFRFSYDGTQWRGPGRFLGDFYISMHGAANGCLFVKAGERELRSTDNGATWQPSFPGSPEFLEFACVAGKDSSIFAGTNRGVYASIDNGATWDPVTPLPRNPVTGWETSRVEFVAVEGATLYAASWGAGLFRSSDGGATWAATDSGLDNTGLDALVFSGSQMFAACAGQADFRRSGVYASEDSGRSWKAANTGLDGEPVNALASRGNYLYAGTRAWGVLRSSDAGQTWTPVNLGADMPNITSFAGDNSSFYVAGGRDICFWIANAGDYGSFLYAHGGKAIAYSPDDGQSWQLVDSALYAGPLLVQGGNLLASREAGLFLSSNHGMSWTNVQGPSVGSFCQQDSILFAGGNGGLFRSTDGGMHWDPSHDSLLDTATVLALIVNNGELFLSSNYGVYRSSDHGTSWNAANFGLEYCVVLSFAAAGGDLFAGTDQKGVFRLADGADGWTPVNSGLREKQINTLAVHGNGLYAGTNHGVWRRPLLDFVVNAVSEPDAGVLPQHFTLEQNYPNPFNPVTNIHYTIGGKSEVSLIVYDLLGREVAVLVNEAQPAGPYTVRWNAGGLASGVYVCRLTSGSSRGSRKMLLVK